MRIYLDVCCLNRPFDDQTQSRVRLESEAVRAIFALIEAGILEPVSSGAVVSEVERVTDPNRRAGVEELVQRAGTRILISTAIASRANELSAAGLGAFDALHLAYAEFGGCDILFTVDDKLLRRVARLKPPSRVRVLNPATWLLESDHGGQTA